MIAHVFKHVVSELNGYINQRVGVSDKALATSLFDQLGNVDTNLTGKVVVSIVNVEQDRTYHSVEAYEKRSDGTAERVLPPVRVNLYLLFIANMKDHDEAAKGLSHVLSFFQHRPSFDFASVPDLEVHKGRFTADLQSMTFEQINHLWGALGGKYMPSVLYKLGLFDIRERLVTAEIPEITQADVTAGS